jgi:hypothetical protein
MDKTHRNQEWAARIRDYKASGLTMSAWCTAHSLTLHQLKYWLRKIADRSNSISPASSTKWIPLTVTNLEVPPLQAPPLVIRIGHAGIEIRTGFDADLLRQVVRALEMPC